MLFRKRPYLIPILLRGDDAAFQWDFTRVYSMPPGTTFTRATVGTYFGSDGLLKTAGSGVPRFDHDPLTGAAKGLLIEEQRTNTCLQSNALTTTWGAATLPASVTLAQANGPDGTASLAEIAADGGSAEHGIIQTLASVTLGASVAMSAYVRKGTTDWVLFGDRNDSSYHEAWFNLNTGAVGATRGVLASKTITSLGGGLYRIAVTYVKEATGALQITIQPTTADSTHTYTPAGTPESIYAGFVQAETGAFPSSYIATTTAAVARNADVATWLFPAAVSAPISAYAEWDLIGLSPGVNNACAISIGDGATRNNFVDLYARYFSGTIRWFSEGNNTGDGDIQVAGSSAVGTIYKGALSIAANDFRGSVNGAAVVQDTSVTAQTGMTTVGLGTLSSGSGSYLNGHLRAARVTIGSTSSNELKRMTA